MVQWQYSNGQIIPEFGFVILVGIVAFFVNFAFLIQVGRSRRKFNIHPPRMTETALPPPNQTNSDQISLVSGFVGETPDEYRRYQRVHLNNVENLPSFYALLIFAGIGFPMLSALFGLIYQIFRVLFAIGYYHSAEQRRWGGIYHAGELGLIGLSLATAIELLKRL